MYKEAQNCQSYSKYPEVKGFLFLKCRISENILNLSYEIPQYVK